MTIPIGASEMSSVGESGDAQADTTVVAESASAISAYNDGGTMYFYAGGDEMDPSMGMANGGINGANVNPTVLSPNFTLFPMTALGWIPGIGRGSG